MATSTLQQQPIAFKDAPVEPLVKTDALKRRDLKTILHYVDSSVTVEQLNADKEFGYVAKRSSDGGIC
jgi:hypothetical protein